MTEVNTFSAAVDDTVLRSGRPDRKADITAFVRTTIRELRVLSLFAKDFTEDQLTAAADPHIWTLPQEFRQMWTVNYPELVDPQGKVIYPRASMPGRGTRNKEHYYYQSGDSMIFAGVGASAADNRLINVAYHSYGRKLPYYDISVTGVVRPATFSMETNSWSYGTVDSIDYSSTVLLNTTAQELVSNWVLFDWYDVVVEGAMAKVLKVTGDDRAVSSFALFSSFKKDMLRGESSYAVGGEIG